MTAVSNEQGAGIRTGPGSEVSTGTATGTCTGAAAESADPAKANGTGEPNQQNQQNQPVQLSADRIKHLEFIQAVITRLGSNSFFIKGWALTLAAGFFAISASQLSWQVAASGLVPLLCFWSLDGYFLHQEKLFRCLYDDARRPDSPVEVLSMNVGPYTTRVTWRASTLSRTLVLFYGALVAADLALVAIAA